MKRILFFALAAVFTAVPAWAERPSILLIVSEDNGPELGCGKLPSAASRPHRPLQAHREPPARHRQSGQSLDAWRQETKDPLLDPGNLQRLTAEVTSVKSKAAGKKFHWSYPDYFFGGAPAVKQDASSAAERPTKKKKKKQRTE